MADPITWDNMRFGHDTAVQQSDGHKQVFFAPSFNVTCAGIAVTLDLSGGAHDWSWGITNLGRGSFTIWVVNRSGAAIVGPTVVPIFYIAVGI